MNKSPFAIFVVALLPFFAGCIKDTLPNNSSSDIIDSVSSRGIYKTTLKSVSKYHYDAIGNLTSLSAYYETYYPHSSIFETITFSYNSQNALIAVKLANAVAGDIYIDSFIYNSNHQIIATVGSPILPTLIMNDHTFAYDAQNRLIGDSQHISNYLSQVTGCKIYTYDINDNIVDVKSYFLQNGILTPADSTQSFTFDNKINPFYKIRIPLYMSSSNLENLSKNNIVTGTPTSPVASTGGYYLSPVTYVYYNNNLPQAAMRGVPFDTNALKQEFFYR